MTDQKFKNMIYLHDKQVRDEMLRRIAQLAEATPDGAANWTLREASANFVERIVKEFEGKR